MRNKASEESSRRNLSRPSRFRCVEPTRRVVTCGGALAAFSLLLTDLLGTASPVKADALAGPIPTLDRVAVRIVTEDYQFAVAPGRKEDGLVVENFGWGIGPDHRLAERWSASLGFRCMSKAIAATKRDRS